MAGGVTADGGCAGRSHPGTMRGVVRGDVNIWPEVGCDGKALGSFWQKSCRVEVTSALKPGANEMTIKVDNACVNRLIGDQQPDATTKYTFADVKPYKANSPLLESGLLGPVRFERVAGQ